MGLKEAEEGHDKVIVNYHLYAIMLGLTEIYQQKKQFGKADECIGQASSLLHTHSDLTSYEQFYWQEKISLEEAKGDEEGLRLATEELTRIKKMPYFREAAFNTWLKYRAP